MHIAIIPMKEKIEAKISCHNLKGMEVRIIQNPFYETSNNHSRAIMLKIPGTGKFRKINYRLYNAIEKQVNQIVESYTREAQIY